MRGVPPGLESEMSTQGKHRGADFKCNFFAFFGDVRNRWFAPLVLRAKMSSSLWHIQVFTTFIMITLKCQGDRFLCLCKGHHSDHLSNSPCVPWTSVSTSKQTQSLVLVGGFSPAGQHSHPRLLSLPSRSCKLTCPTFYPGSKLSIFLCRSTSFCKVTAVGCSLAHSSWHGAAEMGHWTLKSSTSDSVCCV